MPAAVAALAVVAGCATSTASGGGRPSSPPAQHRPAARAGPAGDGGDAVGGANASGVTGSAAPAGSAARQVVGQAAANLAVAARVAAARQAATARLPWLASLPAMSDRQLAGQRIIYSYSGLTPPARLLRRIRNGQAAGVIFFAGNIASRAQIRQVAVELQQAALSKRNPVREPLLLITDQEGGAVRRLPGAPFRSEKQIGESAQPGAEATTAGTGAGRNLHGVDMNVNLAPVLDVYRVAGNFIDEFGRSYSMDPSVVSALGADFITAQQAEGVAATGKHFPGLGAARRRQNTDERPVTLNLSSRTIRTVDEFPYRAAIAAGVKLVMVSWAAYPALGSHRPAGLSSKIVQGELRQRLGFTGVTITDALGAGALRSYGAIPNRSVLAATAGMDLLLCAGQRVGEGIQGLDALLGGYRGGTLDKTAFQAAARRVIALRASLAG
jgi:beta-N-acetylhexosaminidase